MYRVSSQIIVMLLEDSKCTIILQITMVMDPLTTNEEMISSDI